MKVEWSDAVLADLDRFVEISHQGASIAGGDGCKRDRVQGAGLVGSSATWTAHLGA